MRILSQLYAHECIINGCETNSRMVQLFNELDQLLEVNDLHAGKTEEEKNEHRRAKIESFPDFVKEIVPRFVGNLEPQEFVLSSNYVADKGLAAIIKVLLTMPRLKKLQMEEVRLQEKGVDSLCYLMQNHPTLCEVDIRRNPLFATSGRKLTEALRKCPNIIVFLVDMDQMPSRIAKKLASQIGRNMASKYTLTAVLSARKRGWGDGYIHDQSESDVKEQQAKEDLHKDFIQELEKARKEAEAEEAAKRGVSASEEEQAQEVEGTELAAQLSSTKPGAEEESQPQEVGEESEKEAAADLPGYMKGFRSGRPLRARIPTTSKSQFNVPDLHKTKRADAAAEDKTTKQSASADEEKAAILEYLHQTLQLTAGEESIVTAMLEDPKHLQLAQRCYNRCGGFTAQLVADFGIQGSALHILDKLSREFNLGCFLDEDDTAVTQHAAAPSSGQNTPPLIPHPPNTAAQKTQRDDLRSNEEDDSEPIFSMTMMSAAVATHADFSATNSSQQHQHQHKKKTIDPLDYVLSRVRQLSISRGLEDPLTSENIAVMDPEAEEPLSTESADFEENNEDTAVKDGNARPPEHTEEEYVPLDQTCSSAKGVHDFFKQLVKSKKNRLVLHKIEDMHRRLVQLRAHLEKFTELQQQLKSSTASGQTSTLSSPMHSKQLQAREEGNKEEAKREPEKEEEEGSEEETDINDQEPLSVQGQLAQLEADINEQCEGLVGLLVHTWEAVAMTTIENAPLLEPMESAIYKDQRVIIDELYNKQRKLLLLCDQCKYFKRDPKGKAAMVLASNRYSSCRGALRPNDPAALLEEVVLCLRGGEVQLTAPLTAPEGAPATTANTAAILSAPPVKVDHQTIYKRRELHHTLQAMLPKSFIASWVKTRLARGIAAWINSRYTSDFAHMTIFGSLVAPRNAVTAQLVQKGLFYDVPAFPSDLVDGFGRVEDVQSLVVLCRQHAAMARYSAIVDIMPALPAAY